MQNIINFMASYIITIPFLKKPFQDLKHPQRSYAMENAMNLQIALPNGQQHIGVYLTFLNVQINNENCFLINRSMVPSAIEGSK